MNKNTVLIKSGLLNKDNKNKYKIGIALREAVEGSLSGYIVQIEAQEKFYYKEQIIFLRSFQRQVNDMKRDLLILEPLGFPVQDSFKALCDLEEYLS
jgi:hypothetical protein